MQISDSFKVFLLLSFGLIVGNLLVMNTSIQVMNGVEANFIQKIQSLIFPQIQADSNTLLIPFWQSAGWYQMFGFSEFNIRVVGIIVLILSLLGFYFFGKKIFGLKPTLMTILVAGSCFFPINFIKFASGDTWLLGSHLLSFIFLILFLKQPVNKWKWGYWIFVIIGTFVNPLSSLVWNLGLWGYLQLTHSNGKRLGQLWLLPLLAAVYIPLWYFGQIQLSLPYFFMGIGAEYSNWFFPIILFGVLPWFGFLPAAFWDMFQKLKKKEEMAIINLGWILFGIFSQSAVVFIALAFIMAKQVSAFFQKNYPYARLVKAAALLNMIFTFFALFVLLMKGYIQFQVIGYRSVINVSAIYWVMSVIAVIGLFSKNNPMVTGGMAMSGILSALVFWTMVNPLLEQQRHLPQKVFQNLSMDVEGNLIQLGENTNLFLLAQDSIELNRNFEVYLTEAGLKTQLLNFPVESKRVKGFVFINQKSLDALPESHFIKQKKGKILEGGFRYFDEKKKYQLIYFE